MGKSDSPGGAARQRWDAACSLADKLLREGRTLAKADGQEWLASWFTTEIGQLAILQFGVDGKRRIPGRISTGLFYDLPVQLQFMPYQSCMAALDEVQRLYDEGMDVPDWDWAGGFPPGWPASPKDRLKAFISWHDT